MSLNKNKFTRSRSFGSLDMMGVCDTDALSDGRFSDYQRDNHSQSDSSLGVFVVVDNRSEISSLQEEKIDDEERIFKVNGDNISVLEQKIYNINGLLQEQQKLLQSLKEELFDSKLMIAMNNEKSFRQPFSKPDLLKESSQALNEHEEKKLSWSDSNEEGSRTARAKSLLDAIELKHVRYIDSEIREALTEFLQSDELKDRVASTTAESIKEVINSCISEAFPKAYLPILEQAHRRLLRHVRRTLENAFNELEENSASLYKSVHRSSRLLRNALEKHQDLLETNKPGHNLLSTLQDALESILKTELRDWREKILKLMMSNNEEDHHDEQYRQEDLDIPLFSPPSPPQPADPERSIIDQLLKSAEINKKIREGSVNESFAAALSASDLSLVVAACRAAEPARVFSPCRLRAPVLLALLQQLATDMVHDTQLKCRYLEEAIINLDKSDPLTRTHLPLVVGEVRKNLSKFIRSYPSHVASRRITLIIMAADNLLK